MIRLELIDSEGFLIKRLVFHWSNVRATTEAGKGLFTLSSTTLSATNFSLDTSNKRISLGTGNTILIADADDGIQLGHATFASAPFCVTTGGVLKATSGTIGGWTLSSSTLTGGNVTLNSAGEIKVGSLANASTTATGGGFQCTIGPVNDRA